MIHTIVHGPTVYVVTQEELLLIAQMEIRATPRGEVFLGGTSLVADGCSVFISVGTVKFLESHGPGQSISITEVLDKAKGKQREALS